MKKIYGSLGFKLIIASMVLALVTIGLGGVMVFKISEDAIKVDAQKCPEFLEKFEKATAVRGRK